MAAWMQYLIAFAALLALAPLLAWIGVRFGSQPKGGLMLACVLLGIGDVMDQPAKHAAEATDPAKGSPENGEPPLP
jgi:hypothetical protein